MTNTAEASTTNEAVNTAEQGAPVAPEKAQAPSKKGASQKKGAPKDRKEAKGATQPITPFDGTEPTVSAKTTTKAPAKGFVAKFLAKGFRAA